MTLDLESKWMFLVLQNLESDIRCILNAAIPNKQQNRAVDRMVTDRFFDVQHKIRTYVENLPDLKEKSGL